MLEQLKAELSARADPEKAAFFPRFFKTGPGQYGEGDQFIGVTVPQARQVAKMFRDLPLPEVKKLIVSPWHEERLIGVFILVGWFKRGDDRIKKAVYDFYLKHTKWINNWDIVDSSAHFIVGPWLDGRPEKIKVLTRLANSKLVWERRIAMIATFDYIRQERFDEAIYVAEILINDEHDLIQKAVGWMLREVGKRGGTDLLKSFLDKHAATMPRTALRYAIEHFDAATKKKYMDARLQQSYLLH